MIRIGLAALALAAAPLPSAAQTAPQPVQVGAWTVTPINREARQMVAAFGDHVMVSISENVQGIGNFVFSDDRWLLREGDVKPATLSWDGWKTGSELAFIAARMPNGRRVLTAATDAGFTEKTRGRQPVLAARSRRGFRR
ncbi:MAG: hypothetical protein WDN44_02265 [Sphingomonas sp.]